MPPGPWGKFQRVPVSKIPQPQAHAWRLEGEAMRTTERRPPRRLKKIFFMMSFFKRVMR
jgi:hypothetical protein